MLERKVYNMCAKNVTEWTGLWRAVIVENMVSAMVILPCWDRVKKKMNKNFDGTAGARLYYVYVKVRQDKIHRIRLYIRSFRGIQEHSWENSRIHEKEDKTRFLVVIT